MPRIDLQKLLEEAWANIKNFVVLLYVHYPIPAWGITIFILLFFFYRLARFQHQYAEYKAAQKRQRQNSKHKLKTTTNSQRSNRHNHDHDKREQTAHQPQSDMVPKKLTG